MEKNDIIRLRANYDYLVDNLTVSEITSTLYQIGILNSDDIESLEGLGPRKATRHFLMILPMKGSTAFKRFCETLEGREYPENEIAKKLTETNPADYVHLQDNDEVDFDFPVREDERKNMSRQLDFQADLLSRYREDMKTLLEKIDGHEQNAEIMNQQIQKYEELLENMTLVPPQRSQGDAKDDSFLDDFRKRSEKRPRDRPPSGFLTDPIARMLGHDIVHYMTVSILNKPLDRPSDIYATTMRRIVKELAKKHRDIFNSYMKTLDFSKVNGYQTLANVADEMFADGSVNWGRIIVFYAFGGAMARYCAPDCWEESVDMIAEFLGYYVATKLAPWIDDNGGWGKFVAQFSIENTEKDKSNFWKSLLNFFF